MSTLSVCLTTYKRARLLDRTLASLVAQTRQPDELIISDDASPDATAEVVETWRPAFRHLVYRRNPSNLYMPGNLNASIGAATGEYIANLHDADEFSPHLLEKWEAALDAHPSAGFAFCGVSSGKMPLQGNDPVATRLNRSTVTYGYSGAKVYLHDVEPLTPGRVFFERHLMHAPYSIVWGNVMARREAYARLLPFDSHIGWVADVDMWMRMCGDFDVAYVREPLIYLDSSPTPERAFDWNREEALRRVQQLNIGRIFEGSPDRLQQELARHTSVFRRWYLRKMVGLAVKGDLLAVVRGATLLAGRGQPWP